LLFLDNDFGQLDFFIHGLKRHTVRKKSFTRKQSQTYNTLTTSENEVLIFPLAADLSLCKQVCLAYKQNIC